MKRSTASTSLLLSLIMLFIGLGCGSSVPISDASNAPFDKQLLGRWQMTPDSDVETGEMLVLQFNEGEYYVELKEVKPVPCEEEAEVLRLRAYLTEVDGHRLVNAQTIDADEKRQFYFYTYALQDGRLTIQELRSIASQDINAFESSEALLVFVRQNVDNPALYGEAATFVRLPLAN